MQKQPKIFYDMRDFGDDGDVMLIRIEERNSNNGAISQCIMMKKNEVDQIMEIIDAYKRRN